MPFSDFAALRSRLLGAIREEAVNGQTPALRRMQQLRSAMDLAISETAQSAAATDQGLAGRLSQNLGEVYGGTNANAAALDTGRQYGGGSQHIPTGGSQLAAGFPGTARQTPGGFGNAPDIRAYRRRVDPKASSTS
jgi:hypothetical protein